MKKKTKKWLAMFLAVLLLVFVPLGSYTDSSTGKIESEAFAIALPVGIASYELLQYALILIATAAGSYGLSQVNWDRLIWEYKLSYFDSSVSNEVWADSILHGGITYENNIIRDPLLDNTMYAFVSCFSTAVVEAMPDYDLSDLPYLDLEDYNTVDNTAIIMRRFLDYIINASQAVQDVEAMLEQMKKDLEELLSGSGGIIPAPDEIPSVTASNEVNQMICDYLNWIVHSFEANSSFYNPKSGDERHVSLMAGIVSSWLSFLSSKGLVLESSDSATNQGTKVFYKNPNTYSLFGEEILNIHSFLFPDCKNSCFVGYGVPTSAFGPGYPALTAGQVTYIDSYLNRYLSWRIVSSNRSLLSVHASRTPFVLTFNGENWASNSFKGYSFSFKKENDYVVDRILSDSSLGSFLMLNYSHDQTFFSPNTVFEKDGLQYDISNFIAYIDSETYLNPNLSVADVPVLDDGTVHIYTTPAGLREDIDAFNQVIGDASVSPDTDLESPVIRDLGQIVEDVFNVPSDNPDKPVGPDIPVDPDNPADPDKPAEPDIPTDINEYGFLGLEKVFPFCLPFDLIDFINLLSADSEAPHFTWTFSYPSISGMQTYDLEIDLSPFDSVAALVRTMETLLFIVGLIILTRSRMIRG